MRLDPEAPAQVVRDGMADADDRVGGAQPTSFQALVEAALEGGGEPRPNRLEGPGVAEVGDPGDTPPGEGPADGVGRLGRGARDHAVEPPPTIEPQRARASERGPGGDQRLGNERLAERVRPTRVGVRVEQGVDAIVAAQARAQALEVEGAHHVLFIGTLTGAVGGGGQDCDAVPEPSQPLRHRGGPVGAGVAAGGKK